MLKIETGADLIAHFVAEVLNSQAFVVNGGACAFIVDALSRVSPDKVTVLQHEQSAAMAADAVWKTTGKVGVSVSTSGPGATNLITGIACSWFDSVPALHITGQVNSRESKRVLGLKVRQLGFQETEIDKIVSPITKYARTVTSVGNLIESLFEAVVAALSLRNGPVLVDVPMDVQQLHVSTEELLAYSELVRKFGGQTESASGVETRGSTGANARRHQATQIRHFRRKSGLQMMDSDFEVVSGRSYDELVNKISDFLNDAKRPLFLFGAGLCIWGNPKWTLEVLYELGIPCVASWGAAPDLEKHCDLYLGSIGVYGSRLANFAVQNCDRLVVLGSRLDNRQRTSRPEAFAPFARHFIVDIDPEEVRKLKLTRSLGKDSLIVADLSGFADAVDCEPILRSTKLAAESSVWVKQLTEVRTLLIERTKNFESSLSYSPYTVLPKVLTQVSNRRRISFADTGANLCWLYQSIENLELALFTAGGNSPMGYSLPAAIGATITSQEPTVAFIGDGGLQMCLQELQTVSFLDLPVLIFLMDNDGYGIIKQFQDANLGSRYVASGSGYSAPDWQKIAESFGLAFLRVEDFDDLVPALQEIEGRLASPSSPLLIQFVFDPNTPIWPKVEGDMFLHDQWPRIDLTGVKSHYTYPDRPSQLQV